MKSVVVSNKKNDVTPVNKKNIVDEKIYMDFNLIEMPLFSQNSRPSTNMAAVYTIDKKKNIKVEVIPGAGLTIPNEFDQRVYLALVQIAMEFKEKHGLSEVENKVYTTYYEILMKLKITKKGNVNERILEAIDKLKSTKYKLWNCCYKADSGIQAGLYAASFINDYKVVPKSSPTAKAAMDYIGITKSETVLELTLHEFFLHNILNKRGNLVHKYNELIGLTDPIARSIYLHCEKNRAWIGKRYYNTDKKMKISAKKLANTIPLAWASNNISFTVGRIKKAFDFLKATCLISNYVEHKGKPLSDTWYEVAFSWSREDKEYIVTGREEFAIEEINEIAIEEMKEIDLSGKKGVVTKIISNDSIDISPGISISDELDFIIEPIKKRINPATKTIIKQFLEEKGVEFVECSIKYAEDNSTKNFERYLQDTLTKGWAEGKLAEFLEERDSAQAKIEEEKSAKVHEKNRKAEIKFEEQQDHINKNEVEHMYHKLRDNQKAHYIKIAQKLLKNNDKLKQMLADKEEHETSLAISIFAVSNNKYYNKKLEDLCKQIWKINLKHSNL